MNIQTLFARAPVTTLLIASFVLLFIIQMATGVDINEPDGQSLVDWGANYLPLTLTEQPWRLITSAFLHIGFMHLLFNAFAMYLFGQVAEVTFGSVKLLLLFLLSAIGGNLLNLSDGLYWQVLSGGSTLAAGASGGIMGIGMALLIRELMYHTLLKPKSQSGLQSSGAPMYRSDTALLKNLALIMGINLVYGFVINGIDNAGHIGGALTGAILAISFVIARPSFSPLSTLRRALPWMTILVVALVFSIWWWQLHRYVIDYIG